MGCARSLPRTEALALHVRWLRVGCALVENTNTRAGGAGLGRSLVRIPPYHHHRWCHLHDRSTIDHPAVQFISRATQPASLRRALTLHHITVTFLRLSR
jgi:hypothetical protein